MKAVKKEDDNTLAESIGFTGSRHGMTPEQRKAIEMMLIHYRPFALHHGDCLGADAEVHEIALHLRIPRIVIWPPLKSTLRAHCTGDQFVTVKPPMSYLPRDRKIADSTTMLFATPRTTTPIEGSGTWYTVRYAAAQGRPVLVIYPNGDADWWQTGKEKPDERKKEAAKSRKPA